MMSRQFPLPEQVITQVDCASQVALQVWASVQSSWQIEFAEQCASQLVAPRQLVVQLENEPHCEPHSVALVQSTLQLLKLPHVGRQRAAPAQLNEHKPEHAGSHIVPLPHAS
ncbi:MAG TPA: hypothetical protein VI299_24835, partial [Polyangiales bacterium]